MEDKAVRMHNKKIDTNSILVTAAAVSSFFSLQTIGGVLFTFLFKKGGK